MDQADNLVNVLSGMGQSPDEVAETLRAAGIQGVRNAVRFLNPIIRFCQPHVRAGHFALDLIQGDVLRMVLPNEKPESVPLPRPVKEFLDAFNRGTYPDLEANQG